MIKTLDVLLAVFLFSSQKLKGGSERNPLVDFALKEGACKGPSSLGEQCVLTLMERERERREEKRRERKREEREKGRKRVGNRENRAKAFSSVFCVHLHFFWHLKGLMMFSGVSSRSSRCG